MAQWQRTHLQCRRRRFDPWVRKTFWRRKWQPTPVLSPGEFHGQRSLAGYSPGCKIKIKAWCRGRRFARSGSRLDRQAPYPLLAMPTGPGPHVGRALSACTALPAAPAGEVQPQASHLSVNVTASTRPLLKTGSKEGHLHYLHQVTLTCRTLTLLLEVVTTRLHVRSLHMYYLLSHLLYEYHHLWRAGTFAIYLLTAVSPETVEQCLGHRGHSINIC